MSCKICGRNNCTESFHSLEEQNRHEDPEKYYESIIQALKDENEGGLKNELQGVRIYAAALLEENEKLTEAGDKLAESNLSLIGQAQKHEGLQAEVERLKAICENVGELLSTMEDAHLQTAWHILDNAGFTKNHKKVTKEIGNERENRGF